MFGMFERPKVIARVSASELFGEQRAEDHRMQALEVAANTAPPGATPAEIIRAAEAYLGFLEGKPAQAPVLTLHKTTEQA